MILLQEGGSASKKLTQHQRISASIEKMGRKYDVPPERIDERQVRAFEPAVSDLHRSWATEEESGSIITFQGVSPPWCYVLLS